MPRSHVILRDTNCAALRWRNDEGVAVQVIEGDVNEALRLMNMSKISLEDEDVQEQVQHDPVREAFSKVRACHPPPLLAWPQACYS